MSTKVKLQPEDDMDELFLPEQASEALGMRLADMMRFKEGYDGFINFAAPTEHPVCMANTDAGRAGLAFYDSSHLTKTRLAYLPQLHSGKDTTDTNAEPLWFVFVIDKPAFSVDVLLHFIVKHRIRSRFSKLFLLRFFESSLQQL